ncbi:uncharacterized protein LOC135483743 isoform X2 [Lineus longissimus]|uniref:uncharacterized protein LOC135483743 isoform X2 n=1 Tax=Lineus longissimus TaxID=88925 RepID=UPI002B4D12C5
MSRPLQYLKPYFAAFERAVSPVYPRFARMATEKLVLAFLLLFVLISNGELVKNCFKRSGKLPSFVTGTAIVGGSKDAVVSKLHHGGIKMGVNSGCDNGKTDIEVDWDPKNHDAYICREGEEAPGAGQMHGLSVAFSHKLYQPIHQCLNIDLKYLEPVPTSGSHRPVWPKYGQYLYVPPQRWIHSLEHGAIVFLYHPCSDQKVVAQFKTAVESAANCKYITTPFRLPCHRESGSYYWRSIENKPFILLFWGQSLHLDHFDQGKVTDFIKKYQKPKPHDKHAAVRNSAPEWSNFYDGNYTEGHICGGCYSEKGKASHCSGS